MCFAEADKTDFDEAHKTDFDETDFKTRSGEADEGDAEAAGVSSSVASPSTIDLNFGFSAAGSGFSAAGLGLAALSWRSLPKLGGSCDNMKSRIFSTLVPEATFAAIWTVRRVFASSPRGSLPSRTEGGILRDQVTHIGFGQG